MDELRWILLGLGVVLIVGVYFWGRRQNHSSLPSNENSVEIPSFSAKEDDDLWVDGVGPVRVVSKNTQPEPVSDIELVTTESKVDDVSPEEEKETVAETSTPDSTKTSTPVDIDDVVSVFLVVAKDKVMKGEHIYSACLGNNLQYGDMKIFHRLDNNGEIIFSLSDMKKPGWFDLERINDHRTRGISLFAQLSLVDDPQKAVDDMLLCSHSMANLLGAQLCGQDRMLLNESNVKLMREKAKRFVGADQSVDA